MPKRNLAWILIVMVAALATWILLPTQNVPLDKDLEKFAPLFEVYHRVNDMYVERLDEDAQRRFIEGAIAGAIDNSLDKYSAYYPPRQAEELRQRLQGEFIGVGISIEPHDGMVTVITPIEGSPAFHAGIMPGDQIVAVDGKDVTGETITSVAARIKGPPNTEVTLTVFRPRNRANVDFTLTRQQIVMAPVKGFQPLPGGGWSYIIRTPDAPPVGYLRVIEFVEGGDNKTMDRFNEGLARCREAGVVGVVVDLRNNPGGILPQAVQMVDRFINDGLIIREQGAHHKKEYFASAADTIDDMPLVVLINRQSASASEIVAGSLACHQRAVLVGTRSWGKGTMQETRKLAGVGDDSQHAVLKLTTAYYYLPNDWNINRIEPPKDFDRPRSDRPEQIGGIPPTLLIDLTDAEQHEIFDLRRRLDALYPGGRPPVTTQPASTASAETTAATQPDTPADIAARLLVVDRQLAEALAILHDAERYNDLLARTPATMADDEE